MRFYVVTLGCPKNDADLAVLRYHLLREGHELVDGVEAADAVVIDTCGFILEAKRESIETILEFVDYKKIRPDLKVYVAGCLVQRYPRELERELPEVDGWFGVLPPRTIAENIGRVKRYVTDPVAVYEFEGRNDDDHPHAYVKIADGCDRACTFCTIPKFKGGFVSRPIESVRREVEYLVASGKREVILVAQDTTGYGLDLYGRQALPELLRELNSVDGKFWIRVLYLHPDHLTEEIIDAFGCEKVLKYFDLPVQHGSTRVLRLMGRAKGAEELKSLVERIRQTYPEAVIRTSVIVGFPGEKRKDFDELIEFVRAVEFDRLGAFLYSDEDGAVSKRFPGKVPRKVAEARLEELMEEQAQIAFIRNQRFLGKTYEVLFEEEVDGVLIGRGYMDAPEIDGNVFVRSKGQREFGGFAKVRITSADTYDLEGELVG